jgi:undecaprenol kinase
MKRWLKSVYAAYCGIKYGYKSERHIRIHVFIAIAIIFISTILSLSKIEWLVVILIIFGMIALEFMNSAIERTVDLVTKEWDPIAKQAKDLAAAAVLVYAIMAVLIGLIIFIPKLKEVLFS